MSFRSFIKSIFDGFENMGSSDPKPKPKKRLVSNEVQALIDQHVRVLARKWDRIPVDEYGKSVFDGWDREVRRFTKSVLSPVLPYNWDNNDTLKDNIDSAIVDTVLAYQKQVDDAGPDHGSVQRLDDVTDPFEYEQAVAEVLRGYGWQAHATRASGDQGSDVIARRDGVTMVLQCKLWSHPVGNKAVQEAYAAMKHEGADLAVVVTNSTFTKSARELSATTEVMLVHHADLEWFEPRYDEDEVASSANPRKRKWGER